LVVELGAKLFSRAHRFEHAQHNLRGARPMCVIGRLLLKELGVRQDDPELIVQTMKEDSQDLGLIGHVSTGSVRPRQPRRYERQAGLRSSAGCQTASTAGRSALCGSRQSVSTKMRTEPPAVRTYSILPEESQL